MTADDVRARLAIRADLALAERLAQQGDAHGARQILRHLPAGCGAVEVNRTVPIERLTRSAPRLRAGRALGFDLSDVETATPAAPARRRGTGES